MDPAFFKDLGFTLVYSDAQERLDKRAILQGIKQITDQYRPQYPQLRPGQHLLDFASHTLFAKSFLLMVKDLNLIKAE
jgi:hypothetical protein